MSALVALRAPAALTTDPLPLPKDPLSAITDPSWSDKVDVVYLGQTGCRLTAAPPIMGVCCENAVVTGTPTVQMAHGQGNADLWAVLPLGPGTAARSAANGVFTQL